MSRLAQPRAVYNSSSVGLGRFAHFLLLLPIALVFVACFVFPILMMLDNSFTGGDGNSAGYTLSNYFSIVSDSYYWAILWRTTRIALITTVCALLVGYPAALTLYFSRTAWRRVFLLIIISPLFISVVVRTYGWIVLLSPSGLIASILPWHVKLLYTQGAIVVGLVHIYIPFTVLALNAALYKVDRRLLSAAASLGASNWRIFRDVLLPMSVPGILSAAVIVFSISMTAFSTPVLLGGTENKTMPYLIYQQNLLLADWHLGSALAIFMLAATLVLLRVVTWPISRSKLQAVLK